MCDAVSFSFEIYSKKYNSKRIFNISAKEEYQIHLEIVDYIKIKMIEAKEENIKIKISSVDFFNMYFYKKLIEILKRKVSGACGDYEVDYGLIFNWKVLEMRDFALSHFSDD